MPETECVEQKNTRLHGEQIRIYLRERGYHIPREHLRFALGITNQQMERAIEWLTFDDVRLCENDNGELYWNEQN